MQAGAPSAAASAAATHARAGASMTAAGTSAAAAAAAAACPAATARSAAAAAAVAAAAESEDAYERMRLLQVHVLPDEDAAMLLRRATREAFPSGLACVDRGMVLRPGVVLEMAGPHGSAKSELLLQ
eukprot:361821-Chlamydomonas_euryale.AAC.1